MGSSPWAIILKLGAGAVAVLGSFHAVSGATSIVPPYTVNAQVGTTYTRVLGMSTVVAQSWSAGLDPVLAPTYQLAPGLYLTNATGWIGGTPTRAVTNSVWITAWEYADNTGASFAASFTITVTNGGPPGLFSQPASQTADAGGAATLSVSAFGALPLAYQWRFNGVNLPGATTNPLVLASLQLSNAGPYTVVITNKLGRLTSSAATLTIRPPVTLTPFLQGNSLLIAFNSAIGINYFLESSAGLANWTTLTNLIATTTNSSFTVPRSQNNTLDFFRVRH